MLGWNEVMEQGQKTENPLGVGRAADGWCLGPKRDLGAGGIPLRGTDWEPNSLLCGLVKWTSWCQGRPCAQSHTWAHSPHLTALRTQGAAIGLYFLPASAPRRSPPPPFSSSLPFLLSEDFLGSLWEAYTSKVQSLLMPRQCLTAHLHVGEKNGDEMKALGEGAEWQGSVKTWKRVSKAGLQRGEPLGSGGCLP